MKDDGTVVLTAVGDSITAGNPGWDPDPHRRALKGYGDDETSQYLYWAARQDPRISFRNLGVGGERTDQIRLRLATAVEGADVLVIQGGINDIVQGREVERAAADLQAMVEHAHALLLPVLLPDVLPWNNGWPEAEPKIMALNALIHGLADTDGVTLLPFHETAVCGLRPGDYFEVTESNRVRIPEGRHFCLYALSAVLTLLPAKQRKRP